jgi:mannosyltransferase
VSTTTSSEPAGSSSAAPTASREKQAIVALTLLALLLRLTSLSRSLFTDEAYSLALAQRGFGHMLGLFGYEANGTPYPIVLWPLIRIFHSSETLLRLPAVLAGTASVPALWWAARRYAAPAAALIAAALLAVNPMAVFYSQFARPYALVMLAACLAFGALPRALARGASRGPWAGYVLAMALLAYCDILAAPIAIPVQALIARRAGRPAFRRWLLSLGALLICCVPLLIAAAIAHSRRNALYWLPKPDRGLVTLAAQEFTGGFSGVSAVRWATIAAGAVVVGGALWSLRRARDAAEPRAAIVTAIGWGILPPLLLLIVSFARPVFWPRYAIIALPGLCLLFAVAGVRLWASRRGLLVAVGCLAAIALASLFADVRQRDKLQESWPPAAAWLRAQRSSSQPIVLDNVLVLPVLGYYDPAFRAPGGESVVQEWHDRPLPANVVGYKDPGGYGAVADGPPSAAEIAALARRGAGTVWMVAAEYDKELQGDPRTGAAVGWARANCQVQTRESVGVWVMRAASCRG